MFIKRTLLKKIEKYIKARQIIVVLGPRQAGKTTLFKLLSKQLVKRGAPEKNIFYFTFEDPDVREAFNHDPKGFITPLLKTTKGRIFIFFDEYHWVKDGGQKLKLIFDLFGERLKLFVTGSSSLEITFETARFLVGRAYFFKLFPLSFEEFLQTKEKEVYLTYKENKKAVEHFLKPSSFAFEKKLRKYFEEFCLYGGYPEVVLKEDIEEKKLLLSSIEKTYLQKDIRELLLIEDIDTYRKLLKVLASQSSKLLSYASISSELGISFKLLKKYLSILEETFIINLARPFYSNVSSELKKNPKVFFYDTGIRNALLKNFSETPIREDKGELVETYAFTQLVKQGFQNIHYWRTKAKAEVDFVLEKENKPLPIEIKFQNFEKPKVSRSLRSFISAYKPNYALVYTNGGYFETTVEKTKVLFYPVWYI